MFSQISATCGAVSTSLLDCSGCPLTFAFTLLFFFYRIFHSSSKTATPLSKKFSTDLLSLRFPGNLFSCFLGFLLLYSREACAVKSTVHTPFSPSEKIFYGGCLENFLSRVATSTLCLALPQILLRRRVIDRCQFQSTWMGSCPATFPKTTLT